MGLFEKILVLSVCTTFCLAESPLYEYVINDGNVAPANPKFAPLSNQYQQRPQFQQNNNNYLQKSQPTSQVSQIQYIQRQQQPSQSAQRQEVYSLNPSQTQNFAQFSPQAQPISSQKINVPSNQYSLQSAPNFHQIPEHNLPQPSTQFYAQNDQPIQKPVPIPSQFAQSPEYSSLESSSPTPPIRTRTRIALRPTVQLPLQNQNTQPKLNNQFSEQTSFPQNIPPPNIASDPSQFNDALNRIQTQEQVPGQRVTLRKISKHKQKLNPVQKKVQGINQGEILKEQLYKDGGNQDDALQKQQDYDEELIKEQNAEAKYSFSSQVKDDIQDGSLQREEVRDGLALKGMYSYSDGFFKRTVEYEADENGYRIVNENSEPIGEGPAVNPNGKANVASSFDGNGHAYSITADDIATYRDNKAKSPFRIVAVR